MDMTSSETSKREKVRAWAVAAAALTAALIMLAVPLSVADDAYSLNEGEAGYYIETENEATHDELAAVGESRSDLIGKGMEKGVWIVNLFEMEMHERSADSIHCCWSEGSQTKGDTNTHISAESYEIHGVKATSYAFENCTNIFNVDGAATSSYQEAVGAAAQYLGGSQLNTGDRVDIEGDITFTRTLKDVKSFGKVDEQNYVHKVYDTYQTWSYKLDITLKVVRNGEQDGKSIRISGAIDIADDDKYTYTYDKDFSELKQYDKCIRNVSDYRTPTGSITFSVGGTDYQATEWSFGPQSNDYEAHVSYEPESDTEVRQSVKDAEAGLAPSSEHVKTVKGYPSAEGMYSDLSEKISGTDSEKEDDALLIGVSAAIAVAIIAVAMAIVFLRKKA